MVLIALAVGLLYLGIREFIRRAPRYGVPFLWRLLVILLVGAVLWLALTGRLHWLAAAGAALFPFARRLLPYLLSLLRFLPFLQQQRRRRQASQRQTGQQSTVQTQWLSMTLDHDSGDIEGLITGGPYAEKRLGELSIDQLKDLYSLCQTQDPQAIRLLDAYIQRHCAQEWQDREESREGADEAPAAGAMSLSEAWAILGLEPGASRDEVLSAYKRMILKVHPDRGGSNYLAARINEAKALLLKQL
nr:DnaJ domain-containing protein [Motiliproteus sp. SC1-56]